MAKGFWYCASGGVGSYPITPGMAGTVLTSNGPDAYPTYQAAGGGALPAGIIVMWAGLISLIPAGWLLCDGTNGTPDLRSLFIQGAAAGQDPGATGGSTSYTPAGTVSQPTFTGQSGTTSATSAGTPSGSVSAPTFTGSALGTHTHGTGTLAVSAHAGSAVADHAAHTHSVTSNVAVADHASHTHTTASSTATPKLVTGNTSTGVSLVTGGPSATLTHSVTNNAVTSGNPSATLTHSVTQPNDHTMSGASAAVSAGTPTGTVSAPTFTGDVLSTHTHNLTPTGSVSQPTFSGTPATITPPYYALAFLMKAA